MFSKAFNMLIFHFPYICPSKKWMPKIINKLHICFAKNFRILALVFHEQKHVKFRKEVEAQSYFRGLWPLQNNIRKLFFAQNFFLQKEKQKQNWQQRSEETKILTFSDIFREMLFLFWRFSDRFGSFRKNIFGTLIRIDHSESFTCNFRRTK